MHVDSSFAGATTRWHEAPPQPSGLKRGVRDDAGDAVDHAVGRHDVGQYHLVARRHPGTSRYLTLAASSRVIELKRRGFERNQVHTARRRRIAWLACLSHDLSRRH